MANDPLNLTDKTIADKYRIESMVGEGGIAVVYRAIHTIWDQPVAIKFFNGLSSAPPEHRQHLQDDFIKEGALLTELSSHTANIVQARDVGTHTTEDGRWMPYMVLEWLDGETFEELLVRMHSEGGTFSPDEVYALLKPAAEALDLAHGRGIAHRDIKPANIFLVGELGSADAKVKLLDFGVAKVITENSELQAALAKTGTNLTSFTPQYGAPEQFSRGYGATGPWTDVFALALVAVDMICGKEALDGDTLVQLAFSSSNPEVRPTPNSLGASIPERVDAVFRKALAVQPEDRYARAGELWEAFGLALGEGKTLPANSLPAGYQRDSRPARTSTPSNASTTAGATINAAASEIQPPQPVQSKSKGWLGGAIAAAVVLGAAGLWLGLGDDSGKGDGAESAGAADAKDEGAAAVALPPPKPCPEGMAEIPAGQFFMGSDEPDAVPMEKPSHQVKLDSYCIDLHEVTMAEYQQCSDKGLCRRAPRQVEWPKITKEQIDLYGPLCNANDPEARKDHPVNCVDWAMADGYCKAMGKALPTEAQWEFATRGPDGRIYPWGDEAPTHEHLNACGAECVAWGEANDENLPALYEGDDGFVHTAPVGSFPKGDSRFGPKDVAGNVFEWVADWGGDYTPNTSGALDNPTGPAEGDRKVVRGGAWNGSRANWLRPSFRFAADPKMKSHGFGFRCAADVANAEASPSEAVETGTTMGVEKATGAAADSK